MRQQRALSPRFILLGQGVVEAAHAACTWGHSHQGGSNLSDFMGTGTADKHLGERLGYLWFIAIVAFEHLAVKRSFSIVF